MAPILTRRSFAAGALAAVPVLAAATAAPAAQAAVLPDVEPLLADLENGVAHPELLELVGLRTYSTTGGRLIPATTAMNFGLKAVGIDGYAMADCTVYFHTPLNRRGAQTPIATVRLLDGRAFLGKATLGQLATGFLSAGVHLSTSIQWLDSQGSTAGAQDWAGAQVTLPFTLRYARPDRTYTTTVMALRYRMGEAGASALVAPMVDPEIVAY